jgi:hypothetical protein
VSPAFDFIARMQLPVVAQQNHADFVFIDVECDAIYISGKPQHLLKTHAGEAGDLCDARGDTRNRANFPRPQLVHECIPHLAYSGKRAVEHVLEALRFHVQWLCVCG